MPDAATMRTIDGTYAGGLIRLNGADRVTIDGSFSGSGKYLTFENKSTGTSAVIQISSLGVNAGATNNTIQNCIIIGGSSTATTTFGIYAGSTSVSTTGTGAHNNDLMIQNNEIKKAYRAIYASGVASTGLVTGLNIKDNIIGSDVVAEYVLFRGVELANATGAVIDGNKIFNLKLATSVNNAGIDLGANVADAIVSGNEIFGIYSTSTSGYGAYGINISATTTSNITIVNNVIYDHYHCQLQFDKYIIQCLWYQDYRRNKP
jgi:trimeric autotransporter adhesin